MNSNIGSISKFMAQHLHKGWVLLDCHNLSTALHKPFRNNPLTWPYPIENVIGTNAASIDKMINQPWISEKVLRIENTSARKRGNVTFLSSNHKQQKSPKRLYLIEKK